MKLEGSDVPESFLAEIDREYPTPEKMLDERTREFVLRVPCEIVVPWVSVITKI